MNKVKFLNELEKKLKVLNELEKKDILNEYEDIINEKVKSGKSELEAINDFGNIDELSKEILSAYKINPEYSESSTSKFLAEGDALIKEGAKKISKFTKEVIDDVKANEKDVSFDRVFEIVIKVLLVLVGLAFLKLPFMLIEELGESILNGIFIPFDHVFIFIWNIIISLIYLLVCILIIITLFKDYFYQNQVTKEVTKEVKKEEEKVNNNLEKKDINNNFVVVILKLFIFLCFILPLFIINLGFISALIIVIYLMVKGLMLWSVLILLIGLIIVTCNLRQMIFSIFNKFHKYYLVALVFGFSLIILGSILTIDKALSFKYYDTLPASYIKDELNYEYVIDGITNINVDYGKVIFIKDDTLADNLVKININYHNDFIKFDRSYNDNNINIKVNNFSKNYHHFIDLIIDNYNKKEVYNYTNLFDIDYKVSANSNTLKLLERNYFE